MAVFIHCAINTNARKWFPWIYWMDLWYPTALYCLHCIILIQCVSLYLSLFKLILPCFPVSAVVSQGHLEFEDHLSRWPCPSSSHCTLALWFHQLRTQTTHAKWNNSGQVKQKVKRDACIPSYPPAPYLELIFYT